LIILLACLSTTGFAFDLECSKLEKPIWAPDVLSCNVGNIKVTDRGAVMNAGLYDDNDKIKGLIIRVQTVHYVPKITVKMAKRLQLLLIEECGLKEIRKEDLKQFPELKILQLDGNDLEWLEGELFVFNPELVVVSFNGNKKLKYIGANLLDSLPKLGDAYFESTGCIYYDAEGREQVEELKTELKTECKDEPTKLKMMAATTTTTTTETANVITLEPSQPDERPSEASA
jgi:hypothetical protein